ncbi:alpha/beta fold hydrolase [Lysobacter sp. KIS68-7]|uniref:alpha/beta hydrolase n=1 Tax=Lysobacter sp. KIS68-7 TaxID=2904252 RepID=UPI001E51A80A|nr:alpha/beta fold hydrolase [Lysobacter sp. KIS68-7]UHQ18900.1 alpha/beta fold hydrolase [Lysobacter sp. KIS68-7]
MAKHVSTISTTVRTSLKLLSTRTAFQVLGVLNPRKTLRAAAKLFSTPFPSSRARAQAAPVGDAVVGRFELDGHTIATYVWGDLSRQPYVLFAHGWSSHGTRFLPWVPRLREQGYAVVAFDQPAHGRSSGDTTNLPDFAATLLEVGKRFGPAAALVAHSLGGAAASVALAQGLQAERVVLIAPAADPLAATERFAQLIRLPQRLLRALVRSFERQVGVAFDDLQAHHTAPVIARPALIVHDVEDREVPWSEGERYARYWPDSHLLSTQGLGHNRIAGDDTVIAAALRFLHGETVGERVVSSPNLPYGFA